MRQFQILAGILIISLILPLGGIDHADGQAAANRPTWVDAILALRAGYTDKSAGGKPDFGVWYATAPISAKSFSQQLFPESGIDLAAKSNNGKPLWTKHPEWTDGRPYSTNMPDYSVVYMFRTITSPAGQTVDIGLGSDDGIEVWLNGERVLSHDISRALGAYQDKATLNLRPGENRLLMKIHNQSGVSGFFFAPPGAEIPTDKQAAQLWKDYPVEMDWLTQDGPGKMSDWARGSSDGKGDLAALLKPREVATVEQAMISKALAELGPNGRAIKSAMNDLVKTSVGPDDRRWLDLYVRACKQRRLARLQPLLNATKQVIFTKHPTFGLESGIYIITENQGANPKTALCSLDLTPEISGGFAATKTMIAAPNGIRDPEISFDGKRLIYAERIKGKSGLNYQIHEMALATGSVRQLTTDETYGASFEPCYLPNGDIMFSSSRIVQHITCGWGDCSNLFIMNKDGQYARRVGFDQTNTAFPHALEDGRVIYTRRDYNDRGQVWAHKLFAMNPDGTQQMEFWGNSSFHPTTFQHARGIPGTKRVITIIGGYHTTQGGKLAQIDLEEGRQEPYGVRLIPSGEHPVMKQTSGDNYGKEGDQYQYPYPIDKNSFLVCYSLGGLLYPDNSSHLRRDADMRYNLYFMTMDGRRELLAADPDISCLQGVPVMPRPVPHARPSAVDYTKDFGIFSVSDVYSGQSMQGVPRGTVKKLRVVEIRYKTLTNGGTVSSNGPGGYGHSVTPIATNSGTYDVKVILGDAKVYEDGSACFQVPARAPVYFQLLDEKNHVVQTMRSWATLMPAEKMSCVGCHETKQQSPPGRRFTNLALAAGPEKLKPFYGDTRGFSFIKEIQPILDKHCVSCHRPGGEAPDYLLTSDTESDPTNGDNGNPHRVWLKSYRTLTGWPLPSKRYHTGNEIVNWIGRLGAITLHPPYEAGAAKSKMISMMEDGHGNRVKLTREELDKLSAWIDLNVPYCGDYAESNAWSDSMKRDYDNRMRLRAENEVIDRRNIEEFIKAGQR